MPDDGFIAVVRAGTADENGGGKRAWPAWKSECAGERDLCFFVGEGDFFFLVRIGFYGVLRADEFEKLVGALEIEFLLDAVLRPASGDSCLGSVERAVVDASHNRNLEMKDGVFLADLDGGQPANSLVGAIEGGYELLLIVMRNVKLQAEAHAVAFQRALPHTFRASDGIGWLFCAGVGGLERAGPVAFERGGTVGRRRVMSSGSLGRSRREIGPAEES